MNITQAKAAMQRMLGAKAMWRYDERAPNAEERETVRESLPALHQAADAAKAALEERRAELLRDPLYQKLMADYKAAYAARDNALSTLRHYRVTIGKDTGFAMLVMSQADNWQEAIDALKAKQ